MKHTAQNTRKVKIIIKNDALENTSLLRKQVIILWGYLEKTFISHISINLNEKKLMSFKNFN